MMRVGLRPLVTTSVLIPSPRSSFQLSDEQNRIKHDSITYQRPSRIEVVVVMVDHKRVIATMLIILITTDLVEGALTSIQNLIIP
jgi:hypothetical protein